MRTSTDQTPSRSLTWTYAASDRLLIEAGASANIFYNNTIRRPDVDDQIIQVTDLDRNLRYGSRATGLTHAGGYRVQFNRQYHQQVSMSYVTGSHNFKVGFNYDVYREGLPDRTNDPNQINQARSYTFRGRTPQSVTIWAVPFQTEQRGRDIATYVQDQWTMRRLTLNLGLRVNNLNGSVPETTLPAGPFVPARSFPAVKDSPKYWNINPRFGAAYDLFGDSRTALKVSLGRFNPYGAGEGAAAPGALEHSGRQPGGQHDAHLGRRQQQLRARLRPAQLGRERRVRPLVRPVVRADPRREHPLRRGCDERDELAVLQLAVLDLRAARAGAERRAQRGLPPHVVRRLPRHRQPRRDARPTSTPTA